MPLKNKISDSHEQCCFLGIYCLSERGPLIVRLDDLGSFVRLLKIRNPFSMLFLWIILNELSFCYLH